MSLPVPGDMLAQDQEGASEAVRIHKEILHPPPLLIVHTVFDLERSSQTKAIFAQVAHTSCKGL